jgi:putative addiction module CopG family antidote
MNVSLGEVLDAYVRAQVEKGQYGNASEVIRETLRLKSNPSARDVFRRG